MQRAESYRITVRFPWIDAVWVKKLGDAQRWMEIDVHALAPDLHQFCLRMAYTLQYDTGCLLSITRHLGKYKLTHAIPVTIVSITRPTILNEQVRFGADPEFVLRRFEHLLIAANYVPRHSWIGTDTLRIAVDKQVPALVELRPEAELNAARLSSSISRLIQTLDQFVIDDSIHFIAGSMPFPGVALGGHVHISGVWPEVDLIRVLDNYLALPLAMCEWPTSKARRPRYGQLGDIRFKAHGGFEYRTCPSWLEHPDFTIGVLTIVEFLTTHHALFTFRWLSDPGIVTAFYAAEEGKLLPIVQLIWEEFWQWRDAFSDFNPVANMFGRIFAGYKWSTTDDFRTNWHEQYEKML